MHDLIEEREIGMSEHTPGPWSANGLKNDGGFEISSEGRPFVICARNPVDHRAGESNANAVLIAAAPDLLAAAQALEAAELGRNDDCEECGGQGEPEACGTCFPPFDDARIMRREAIAKATGVPLSSAVVQGK